MHANIGNVQELLTWVKMKDVFSIRRIFFNIQYFFSPRWDTGISPPELAAAIRGQPAGRALDLGCGTGTNAVFLAKNGWRVVGVDFVKHAIRAAKRKARMTGVNVNFLCEDVARLRGVSGEFDLILDIGCLHSLPPEKREVYYTNLNWLLDKQGTYLLYAFIKQEYENSVGLDHRDVDRLNEIFMLVSSEEGSDSGRRSCWFTWQKPSTAVETA